MRPLLGYAPHAAVLYYVMSTYPIYYSKIMQIQSTPEWTLLLRMLMVEMEEKLISPPPILAETDVFLDSFLRKMLQILRGNGMWGSMTALSKKTFQIHPHQTSHAERQFLVQIHHFLQSEQTSTWIALIIIETLNDIQTGTFFSYLISNSEPVIRHSEILPWLTESVGCEFKRKSFFLSPKASYHFQIEIWRGISWKCKTFAGFWFWHVPKHPKST